MASIKKNYVYNIVYQLLNIILPLITVPIISRALGPDASGVYSYTFSIVSYFMIFGMLGISNYGNRKIAKSRDDPERLKKNFLSIYTVQLCFNIAAIVVYLVYVFGFAQYKNISLIEIFFLLSNTLDISWLYFGLEEFKKPVTRNIIIKLAALLLIICFVKTPADLPVYTAIMSISTALSQMILWIGLRKYFMVERVNVHRRDVTGNIKGILILFIPVISYSVYKMMDIIMLGLQSDMSEVGYYQYAEKIIGIPLGFIAALGTVMLPQLSNLIENKKVEKAKEYIRKSLNFIMFFAIPCVLGLIAISGEFSVLFLGPEYGRTGTILIFLAITLVFTAWATVVRTQWLIPTEKDNAYVYTTILGAAVNFVINLAIIPVLGGVGAAIGTIASEFIIMFMQSFLVRKELKFTKVAKTVAGFVLKGLVMFVVVETLSNFLPQDNVLRLIFKVTLGAAIYLLLNIKYIKSEILTDFGLKKILRRGK